MRRIIGWALFVGLTCLSVSSVPAQAQATRTWVSGVGDDVNACSRAAPCKTFAGAIAQTADGGEIDCVDAGGFGTVTILKSITIDCGGTFGSILASGTNGINVNSPGSNVVLRNLSIDGAGTTLGLRAINILAANSVSIENVTMSNFSQQAIADVRPTAGTLTIIDSVARNVAGAGLGAATGGALKLQINNFRSFNNGFGISLGASINATIANSELSGNTTAGIDNEGANIAATNNAISNNVTGILNQGGTTRLSNNDLFNNTTGIKNVSGNVISYGNNRNNSGISGPILSSSQF